MGNAERSGNGKGPEKRQFSRNGCKKLAGAITDQKIDRAWNEYQLARGLREACSERERFRSQNRKLEKLIRNIEAVEKGEENLALSSLYATKPLTIAAQ